FSTGGYNNAMAAPMMDNVATASGRLPDEHPPPVWDAPCSVLHGKPTFQQTSVGDTKGAAARINQPPGSAAPQCCRALSRLPRRQAAAILSASSMRSLAMISMKGSGEVSISPPGPALSGRGTNAVMNPWLLAPFRSHL